MDVQENQKEAKNMEVQGNQKETNSMEVQEKQKEANNMKGQSASPARACRRGPFPAVLFCQSAENAFRGYESGCRADGYFVYLSGYPSV